MENLENNEPQKCLNCDKIIKGKAKFCPNCGQKNNNGKIKISELLGHFWEKLTHLDSKFLKVSWELFVPGKVTIEYFKGRHKRYPNPVQFFFIVMFFFLYFLNSSTRSDIFNMKLGNEPSFTVSNDTTVAPKKSKINSDNFYVNLERYVLNQQIRAGFDSLPAAYRTPQTRKAIDTLIARSSGDLDDYMREAINIDDPEENPSKRNQLDSIPISFFSEKVKISTADLVFLSPDDILEKYGIKNWKSKIVMKQGIKSIKNPMGLVHSYLGSMTWTIIALITLMSFILYLLYIRQKRYYVEHFVFLMHQHSAAFLFFSVLLLINKLSSVPIWVWVLAFLAIPAHLYFSMKRYYGQSAMKTGIKWIVYNLLYLMGFVMFFSIGMMVVFVFF